MSGPVRARGARNSGFHMSVQRERGESGRKQTSGHDCLPFRGAAESSACGDSRAHWRSLQNGYSHPRDLGAR